MDASSPSGQPPLLFLLDAAAMGSPAPKSWEIAAGSHNLDTSERLIACYQSLRSHQRDARILTLLEADGCTSLLSEWRDAQDTILKEIASTLQCVPFGCRVTSFLVELATQRVAKGYEVAVISNDVDIVVASRAAPSVRWLHLGFMFVDGELLLPGLAQISPRRPSVTSSSSKPTPSRQIHQTPNPKASSHLRVQKSIQKTQSGQGRSGSGGLRESPKKLLRGDEIKRMDECEPDGTTVQGGSPSSQRVGQSSQEMMHAATQVVAPPERLPTRTLKELGCHTYMYADTQLDVDMIAATHHGEPSDAHSDANEDVSMDEGSLQPTIEQEGAVPAATASAEVPCEAENGSDESASAGAADCAAATGVASAEPSKNSQGSNSGANEAASARAPDCAAAPCVESDNLSKNSQGSSSGAKQDERRDDDVQMDPASDEAHAQECTPKQEEDAAMDKDGTSLPEVVVVVEDEAPVADSREPHPDDAEASQAAGSSQPRDITGVAPGTGSAAVNADAATLPVVTAPVAAELQVRSQVSSQAPSSSQQVRPPSSPCAAATQAREAALEATVFDVDMLLGNWRRNGGRTHLVQLKSSKEDGDVGVPEFWPEGVGTPKPIVRSDDKWSLNGYVLDEANSSKNTLRWVHAGSGAVRTWWRPEAKQQPEELSQPGDMTLPP